MITITPNAIQQIKQILLTEDAESFLRVSVSGGGCSGFKYGFSLDSRQEDDMVVEQDSVSMLVDPISAQYLEGAVIDYRTSIESSQFTIENPNFTSKCGCGSSFGI